MQTERVRKNTSPLSNLRIDEETFQNIEKYFAKSDEELSQRIEELDEEWDIERVLTLNLSSLALSGLALSLKNKKWLALPTVVVGFMTQHVLQGWCPPMNLFRYFKFRTREEIDQEKHALKALRGDYDGITTVEEAYIAVKE